MIDDRVNLEPAGPGCGGAGTAAFQPVCQPDCLGLCPVCGVRLLDEPGHGGDEAPIDPGGPHWAD